MKLMLIIFAALWLALAVYKDDDACLIISTVYTCAFCITVRIDSKLKN